MTEAPQSSTTSSRQELLASMVERRQLSAMDAEALARRDARAASRARDGGGGAALARATNTASATRRSKTSSRIARCSRAFPRAFCSRRSCSRCAKRTASVEVAVSRLFATPGLDSLRALTDLKLQPVLAPSEALQREIKKHLGVGADTLNLLEQEEGFQVVADDREDSGDLDKAAEDASIIRFVNQVLSDAISLRASDIHVEPFEHELRIRYRIDGLLQEVPVPAQIKRFQPAIVSRIKILSNLNIAEKRVPQDGRIKIRVKGDRGRHPRLGHPDAARRSGRACVCCGRMPA